MISWIQRSFQQHFRVIFSVLLAGTVISFIFTIGSTPGVGGSDRESATRDFFGHNLASQEEMQHLIHDARVSAELQFGSADMDGDQLERYAFQRVASLHLAGQLGIPAASDSQIRGYIQSLRAFANDKGAFDASRYAAFLTSLKDNPQTSGAMANVISDDIRIEQVEKILAGPGYILPSEIKTQLTRSDSKWTIAMATVAYAGYNPAIDPSDVQLLKFFEENSFRYQISKRISAEAVEFPAVAYIGQVSVTDAEVKAYYDQNPARFPKPAPAGAKSPVPPKPDPSADFAAVRPEVEAALKLERARSLAAKAASDFAYELYDGKIVPGPALDSLLSSHHLAAKTLVPFTEQAGPAEYNGSKTIADAAFKLDSDRYYSEALPSPAGSVIVLWKGTLPVRQPALTEVRPKVRADFIDNEKRKEFVELGRRLKTAIEARLNSGEPFEKAATSAAAATSVKIEVKALPPFTLRDRPKDIDSTALGALEHLGRGQVSDMAITADKGILVYAADRKIPDLSEANPRYAELRSQMTSYAARMGSGAALSELVESELKRTAPAVR